MATDSLELSSLFLSSAGRMFSNFGVAMLEKRPFTCHYRDLVKGHPIDKSLLFKKHMTYSIPPPPPTNTHTPD